MATERKNCPAGRLHTVLMLGLFVIIPLAIVMLESYTNIDLAIADAYFDPVHRVFPWQHAWITETFGHVMLQRAFVLLGAGVILACIWDAVRPLPWLHALRRMQLRMLAASAVIVPSTVSMLKHFSATNCPWDLQRYGGEQPYMRLLDAVPEFMHLGHCFPGGHASSALWLVALAVFWLPHRPHKAVGVGIAMLIVGFAVGWLQQLRGAHFLTHTLWSMWIACVVAVLLGRAVIASSSKRQESRHRHGRRALRYATRPKASNQ